jgi:hypothetical protein
MKTRLIKITVTDESGIVLDFCTVPVPNTANQVTVLAHESCNTPNAAHDWVADLNIGKGK